MGRCTYAELLECVWAVIEAHEHRNTLRPRLREELEESVGMCFTGRATRLLNALHGVVEGVHIGVSARDAMQARVASILNRLATSRSVPNATEVVAGLRKELEGAIQECNDLMTGEREAWLDAFDDAAELD